MISRFFDFLRCKIREYKRFLLKNKVLFGLSVVAALAGIIWALIDVQNDHSLRTNENIILLIYAGDFSYVGFIFKILLFSSVVYLMAVVLCCNRILFFVQFFGELLSVRFFMRAVFGSCFTTGWTGLLLLLTYYLPIVLVFVFLYGFFVCRLYNDTCAGTNIKYISPIKCTIRSCFGLFKRSILLSIGIIVLYSIILLVLFTLVFS